jgi:hypothetical protein
MAMKRMFLYVLIVLSITATGGAWAQESESTPAGSISFVMTNSLAPIGLGAEFFLGQIGLGATFTTFVVGSGEGGIIATLEPGAYGRYYLGDLESTFFLMGGVSYLTAAGAYEGDVDALDFGLLKVNAGVGYHSLTGKNQKGRFSIELGPRYRTLTGTDKKVAFPLLLHFMLMFGAVF